MVCRTVGIGDSRGHDPTIERDVQSFQLQLLLEGSQAASRLTSPAGSVKLIVKVDFYSRRREIAKLSSVFTTSGEKCLRYFSFSFPPRYKLMMSCWHLEPGMRPSFKELTCHWERMLEDGVEYLDLNPRTVHNQAYFESLHLGRTDGELHKLIRDISTIDYLLSSNRLWRLSRRETNNVGNFAIFLITFMK